MAEEGLRMERSAPSIVLGTSGDHAISPTNPGEIGRWFDSVPSFCGEKASSRGLALARASVACFSGA
jgi:hypothetical protein